MNLQVRPAEHRDIGQIQAIYAHHVLRGFGTFEEVPPSTEEMESRLADVAAKGLPWLVAVTDDGSVLGYAYAAPFRARAAYRHTLEDSIYVDASAQRRGVGKALLNELVKACETWGCRQLLGVIGDSQNRGSIALHEALGFEHAGVLRSVGFKAGQWVDVVMMQKSLNGGPSRAAGY